MGEAPIIHEAVALKRPSTRWTPCSPRTALEERRKVLAGEWPDDPPFRFLLHWALRPKELGDPGLCADAPDVECQSCGHCPLDRLDAAQTSEKGLVPRRTLDLTSALKLAVHIGPVII